MNKWWGWSSSIQHLACVLLISCCVKQPYKSPLYRSHTPVTWDHVMWPRRFMWCDLTPLRKLSTINSTCTLVYGNIVWFIGILLPRQIGWCAWFYPEVSKKRQKWPLFLKFTHHQARNYRAGKTRFWCPSLYHERFWTEYGWIHNQHHSANTMTPSLVRLTACTFHLGNKIWQWILYGSAHCAIINNNNCRYGTVTTPIQVELYRAIQGLFLCCIMCCRNYGC